MSFGNPAGAWALLGLIAVVAIHLLQRRRHRVRVSTLFLLAPRPSSSLGGRRLERLRRSASLWLQLAAAAVLAFVLMRPLRLLEDSRQRAVVVVDASVSMAAFRAELREALGRRVAEVAGAARHTDWALLESVPGRRPLYSGSDAPSLLAALESWEPQEPHHDPAAALESARALAGADGLVLFATDHEADLPEGFERLAVGRPLENVGIVGVDVDAADAEAPIRAVVRNHGRQAVRRELWAESDGGRAPAHTIELAAGEVRILTIPFPKGREAVTLALTGDAFAIDDRAPVVRPRPKRVRARLVSAEPTVAAWLSSLGAVDIAEPADIVLGTEMPAAGGHPDETAPPAVRWLAAGQTRLTRGAVVAERHPLVEGLAWHGIVTPVAAGFEPAAEDTVLVWTGSRPLVFLRGPRQLHLNFPIAGSNAERVPALLVLLQRFVENVRRDKVAPQHGNFECGQELVVATHRGEAPPRLEWDGGNAAGNDAARAPWRPAFFHVSAGGERRLVGATHFADVREADFTRAVTSHRRVDDVHEVRRRHARDDPFLPLWIGLLGALLIADWSLAQRAAA